MSHLHSFQDLAHTLGGIFLAVVTTRDDTIEQFPTRDQLQNHVDLCVGLVNLFESNLQQGDYISYILTKW